MRGELEKATKFIPKDGYEDAMLAVGEKYARQAYKDALIVAKQSSDIHEYDFNRGFEFGIQYLLDHPIVWEQLKRKRGE